MVNYHDPVVVAQDASAVLKIWCAVAGLYFWEFVTTLDFEWSVIRKHRPFLWTMWVYTFTRIFTLIAIIFTLVGMNSTSRNRCEVETVFQLLFGYLANASASLLIVLRILAIWNKNNVIIAIAAGAWGINAIFQIQCIVRIRVTCQEANLQISKLNILVTLATDITLLLIMFFGLLRLGFHERSTFGLGRLVWKQGVIWLLVATIAEVLPAVLLCLNLNVPFDYMFLPPSMVTLSIAATRIYRCLADQASFGRTKHLSGLDSSERSGHVEWEANRGPITVRRMEVAISNTSDQDQTLQTL